MYLSYRDIEKIADTVMHDFNAEFYGNTAEAKEPHPVFVNKKVLQKGVKKVSTFNTQ